MFFFLPVNGAQTFEGGVTVIVIGDVVVVLARFGSEVRKRHAIYNLGIDLLLVDPAGTHLYAKKNKKRKRRSYCWERVSKFRGSYPRESLLDI